jgi:hypothetical protein
MGLAAILFAEQTKAASVRRKLFRWGEALDYVARAIK